MGDGCLYITPCYLRVGIDVHSAVLAMFGQRWCILTHIHTSQYLAVWHQIIGQATGVSGITVLDPRWHASGMYDAFYVIAIVEEVVRTLTGDASPPIANVLYDRLVRAMDTDGLCMCTTPRANASTNLLSLRHNVDDVTLFFADGHWSPGEEHSSSRERWWRCLRHSNADIEGACFLVPHIPLSTPFITLEAAVDEATTLAANLPVQQPLRSRVCHPPSGEHFVLNFVSRALEYDGGSPMIIPCVATPEEIRGHMRRMGFAVVRFLTGEALLRAQERARAVLLKSPKVAITTSRSEESVLTRLQARVQDAVPGEDLVRRLFPQMDGVEISSCLLRADLRGVQAERVHFDQPLQHYASGQDILELGAESFTLALYPMALRLYPGSHCVGDGTTYHPYRVCIPERCLFIMANTAHAGDGLVVRDGHPFAVPRSLTSCRRTHRPCSYGTK